MRYLAIILVIFIALVVFYLNSFRPNTKRKQCMEPFKKYYIAHRGLFDNKKDIPENSITAFKKAVDAGYGIELDVQLTTDNQLVVFHDATLKRMCGDKRVLHKLSYQELCQLHLLDTDEKIPLLKEVLDVVNGAVPLIIEIKSEGRYIKTSELTNEMLMTYNGLYCIESFHPLVVLWYKKHSPNTIRGQLSADYSKVKSGNKKTLLWQKLVLSNMLLNFMSLPDFIAYNHKQKNQFSYTLCRKLYKPVNVAWTIKSQEELENARDTFEIFIFDSFIPK